MSNTEEQKRIMKAERQGRINRAQQIRSFITYLSLCVSWAGWIVSVGSFAMYLKARALYPETQYLLSIAFLILLGFSRATLGYYFRRLPWYASAIPIAILLNGIWHVVIGFGTLNEMPPDVRAVAQYHQLIFAHSLFISGFTFFCFLWSFIFWEQWPRKKSA
jgi:hypothetical protein